ncbi:uncharacterized protein CC84DRAFT_1212955 [Paraphaeosphaeria sporulosa]|uniref:Uncharacterized protein n=1 Tax=Paraphaeosphaeria sporulosa TaxID=1460663 RepID=A0A177CQF0_9PLEO|nr:uncharacterized protein CC84DRAFT_1212955 [Paraphaeosphaeria sporulosa]OAG09536.1 hypothetical protein CC84DRAFT_1212955 [Paraphaeosphaeria sporulosa]
MSTADSISAANPPTWNTAIVTSTVLAIIALLLGIPGALLAVIKLRRPKRAKRDHIEIGNANHGFAEDQDVQVPPLRLNRTHTSTAYAGLYCFVVSGGEWVQLEYIGKRTSS